MKNFRLFIIFLGLFANIPAGQAAGVAERAAGRIVLQVENKGEAWYVDPASKARYYLGRPDDAIRVIRERGIGISNKNLARINADRAFARRQAGKIFLQVEARGEAWYIDPLRFEAHYLGRPIDAFRVMRDLGLGIKNADLYQIRPADFHGNYSELEKIVFEAVNLERVRAGLPRLVWNNELSDTARLQSADLAKENVAFTGQDRTCDYPLIHHENLENGTYNSDRLTKRGIFDYSQTGENIALISSAKLRYSFFEDDPAGEEMAACQDEREALNDSFRLRLEEAEGTDEKFSLIRQEISARTAMFRQKKIIKVQSLEYYGNNFLSAESVSGWMNSPGHRDNILNAGFDESGIGAVVANGYLFVTQIFIKRAECGFVQGPCCQESGYQYCFSPLSCAVNGVCRE